MSLIFFSWTLWICIYTQSVKPRGKVQNANISICRLFTIIQAIFTRICIKHEYSGNICGICAKILGICDAFADLFECHLRRIRFICRIFVVFVPYLSILAPPSWIFPQIYLQIRISFAHIYTVFAKNIDIFFWCSAPSDKSLFFRHGKEILASNHEKIWVLKIFASSGVADYEHWTKWKKKQ